MKKMIASTIIGLITTIAMLTVRLPAQAENGAVITETQPLATTLTSKNIHISLQEFLDSFTQNPYATQGDKENLPDYSYAVGWWCGIPHQEGLDPYYSTTYQQWDITTAQYSDKTKRTLKEANIDGLNTCIQNHKSLDNYGKSIHSSGIIYKQYNRKIPLDITSFHRSFFSDATQSPTDNDIKNILDKYSYAIGWIRVRYRNNTESAYRAYKEAVIGLGDYRESWQANMKYDQGHKDAEKKDSEYNSTIYER